jgi:hypothetical protein
MYYICELLNYIAVDVFKESTSQYLQFSLKAKILVFLLSDRTKPCQLQQLKKLHRKIYTRKNRYFFKIF